MRYYPVRNFDVMAGFIFNVYLHAKSELDNRKYDIIDHIHKRSAHFLLGAGYEMEKFYVEGYYGLPLSKLARTSTGRRALGSARENVFMVTLGYHIKLY